MSTVTIVISDQPDGSVRVASYWPAGGVNEDSAAHLIAGTALCDIERRYRAVRPPVRHFTYESPSEGTMP